MPDRIRLDGRVAVVTGAAGVIGTATMRLLAERGARIVAVDRRERDLKAANNPPPPNDKIVERIPARRLGQASEVASTVAFLASDEASYVSGSAYTVDGGPTAA
jgi:NAD(P)-dependent dehydrogenase (short-subunit alcohol dehydrogenase family)